MLKSYIKTTTLPSTVSSNSVISTNANTSTNTTSNESLALRKMKKLNSAQLSAEQTTERTLLGETYEKFPKLSISSPRNLQRGGMEWNRSLPESRDTLSLHGMRRAQNFRFKFRRSHTCGSLFAKCNCAINPDTIRLENSLQHTTQHQEQQQQQRPQEQEQHNQQRQQYEPLQNNNSQVDTTAADNLTMKLTATTNTVTHAVAVHQPLTSQTFHLSVSPSSNTDLSSSLASIMSHSGKRSTTSGFCSLSSQTSAATSAYLSRDDSLSASFDYVNTTTTNTTIIATNTITTSHDTQFYCPDDLSKLTYNPKIVDSSNSSKLAAKTNRSLSKETPAQSSTTEAQRHQVNHNKLMVPQISSTTKLGDTTSPKKDSTNKKLFTSYTHPDTNFIFTDTNKHASREQVNLNDEETAISARGGKIEIKRPKRSSSPNIGNFQILDVAVHPDILVKISPKHTSLTHNNINNNTAQQRRRLLRRTREIDSESSTSESEKSVDNKSFEQQHSLEISPLLTTTPTLINKYSLKSDSNNFQGAQRYFSESGILGPLQQTSTNFIKKTSKILQDSQVIEQIRKTSLILRSNNSMANNSVSKEPNTLNHNESGIVTAESATTTLNSTSSATPHVANLSSPLLIRHISTQCGFSPNILTQSSIVVDDKDVQIKSLLGEIVSLKDVIKSRDAEIIKLRHEIHKLKQDIDIRKLDNDTSKSVLQLTTTTNRTIPTKNNDYSRSSIPLTSSNNKNVNCLIPSLSLSPSSSSLSPNHLDNKTEIETETEAFCEIYQDKLRMRTKCLSETDIGKSFYMSDNGNNKRNNAIVKNGNIFDKFEINKDQESNIVSTSNNLKWDKNNNHVNISINRQCQQQIVTKKQGVSGESWDTFNKQQNINLPIPKYDKDYLSKHLIKEAIMDNDFLKNIDAYQVKELVDSMYELCIESGHYVIREGDVGAHLYVSAEGEFEVIKNNQTLSIMGPGKAFGELAILYNCTRTASVRVLSQARVWVLDRHIFQHIMMRTGMQRIEKSVNFLKSVPLLKNLSDQLLAKIADVLEVEFYSAGTYIIRQGTKGDTFFLISQGSVKVTQKSSNTTAEKFIRTLERGDYFGERALIDEDKRTANIIALAPGVECLTLDRDSFTDLIGDLSELKEKSYHDETHTTITRGSPKINDIYCYYGTNKAEYPQLRLTDLKVITTLGLGGFGRVELVKTYQDNQEYTFALKCLKKCHIVETKQEEHIFNERNILISCQTPFICRMYRTFRDDKYVYMLMEPCMGGEIWTMLRDHGAFSETAAQFIIGCVLEAFEYLHARSIIYRDLKPENLMMDERGYVKLVDFGFAKPLNNSNKTWTFCGTPEYVAPEIILNKGHDRAVDYWALGILIHELLTGTPPFTANEPMQIYNAILKGIDLIDFPKHISRASVQIIKRLCRDMPTERLGYQKGGILDIKKHKWFLGFDWDGLLNQSLIPPFVRPIAHSTDTCYFDKFPCDPIDPPDELSGWDANF